MERGLLRGVAGEGCVAAVLDEEGGGKGISSQDGQVQQAVALCIHAVQVALVAHQCGGDSLVAAQQGQVKGDVPFVVAFVEPVGKLWV